MSFEVWPGDPEFRDRHEREPAEKLAQAKTGKAQLVLIGDSITQAWERQRNYTELFGPYDTLNLGFGGDRTENVLWRIQNGQIDGISPKLVVLKIGTNNNKQTMLCALRYLARATANRTC